MKIITRNLIRIDAKNNVSEIVVILSVAVMLWMVGEIVNFRKRNIKDFWELVFGSLLVVHKQLIESRHS